MADEASADMAVSGLQTRNNALIGVAGAEGCFANETIAFATCISRAKHTVVDNGASC